MSCCSLKTYINSKDSLKIIEIEVSLSKLDFLTLIIKLKIKFQCLFIVQEIIKWFNNQTDIR